MATTITHRHLFDLWVITPNTGRCTRLVDEVSGNLCSGSRCAIDYDKLKLFCKRLCENFASRWAKAYRAKSRFYSNHSEWLASKINTSSFVNVSSPNDTAGRPVKSFSDCTLRTKQKKAMKLCESVCEEQLFMAAETKLRSTGKRNSAELVKELFKSSPERGTCVKRSRKAADVSRIFSADQAVAMIIDTDLSVHQYNLLRQHTKPINPKLYPCYDIVRAAKQLCYPEDINVTESCAKIHLQSLIDHILEDFV